MCIQYAVLFNNLVIKEKLTRVPSGEYAENVGLPDEIAIGAPAEAEGRF
jgi:hypothetical protein